MATKKAKDDTTEPATTETAVAAPADQLVLLSAVAQKELFMHPTNHNVWGECARTGQFTTCGQYPRSEVRMDHLAKDDREEFNRKLDYIAQVEADNVKAKAASDAAAAKKAQDDADAAIAAIDAAYEKAVADRKALEAKEAAAAKPATTAAKSAA
jgi:hypothetical protein